MTFVKAMPCTSSEEDREDAAIAQLIVNSLRTHSINAVHAPNSLNGRGFEENCWLDRTRNHDGMDYVSRVLSRFVGAGVTQSATGPDAATVFVHYHNGLVYFTLDTSAPVPVAVKPLEAAAAGPLAPSVADVRACIDAASKRLADKEVSEAATATAFIQRLAIEAAAAVIVRLEDICKKKNIDDSVLAKGFPIKVSTAGGKFKQYVGNAAFMAALNAELAPTGWRAGFTGLSELLISPLEPETETTEDQVIKSGVSTLLSVCKISNQYPVGALLEIAVSHAFLHVLTFGAKRESVNSSIAHMRWRISHWRSTSVFLVRVATDWEGFFCRSIVDDLRMLRDDVVSSNFSAKLGCGDVVVDVSKDLYRRLIDLEFRGLVNLRILASTGWKIDGLTTGVRLKRIC